LNGTEKLIQNNRAYAKRHQPVPDATPITGVAVVHCMDHRINIFEILGVSAGDVDRIANAGGVVTNDVLRSLIVSQRRKGTTEIMVVAHTPCGMQGLDEAALIEEIYRDTGKRPSFPLHSFAAAEQSVTQSLATLRACKLLPHRDAITGWVFDMESGELREVVTAGDVSASPPRPRTTALGSHVMGSGRRKSGSP
jgi:carbonic anhydrase